jgi:hypothetical protein
MRKAISLILFPVTFIILNNFFNTNFLKMHYVSTLEMAKDFPPMSFFTIIPWGYVCRRRGGNHYIK